MLRVDPTYRQKQNNILYTLMIKQLWPELLDFPFNPHFKKRVIRLMRSLNIYNIYRNALPEGILDYLKRLKG
jgi:hypothetical protein